MKKITILITLSFLLFSCQTREEKELALAIEQKKERIKQNKIETERKILEKTRRVEKEKNKQALEKQRKFEEDLLSDSLVMESFSNNRGALELLNKKTIDPSRSAVGIDSDFETDSSITKYVNNKISFQDLAYIPENLVDVVGEYIHDLKQNSTLKKEALENLDALSQNFYLQFKEQLKIVSAYRSYDYQAGIKERGCSDSLCAKAGFSEHQSGLAIDLWEASTEERFTEDLKLKDYFEWMNKNAYTYGFINTYKRGIEIDGYANEPWHWRFVGIDFATFLYDNDLSFAEFYYGKENF